jgi:N-acetylmuramoyl-L-alanine amidase
MRKSPVDRLHRVFTGVFLILFVLSVQACGRRGYVAPPYGDHPYQSRPYHQPQPTPQAPAKAQKTDPTVIEKCPADVGTHRTVTHEVGPLETLWRLSKMYDVPVEAICSANRMQPNTPIHIGQKLTIPNAKPLRHVVNLYPNTRWKYIVIHHTATDIGNATSIHRVHGDRGFWNGLGYHFLIGNGTLGKMDGQIEMSPRWIRQQVGAHCKAGGMNESGIGIALVGNFNSELPTPRQLESLTYLLTSLSQYYKIPSSRVFGHGDVDGAKTDCPGKRFPLTNVKQCLRTR